MRWKEILSEGVVDRYMPMFNAYLAACDPDRVEYHKTDIANVIKGHASVYKRADRIVYMLRWTRFSMVVNTLVAPIGPPDHVITPQALKALDDAYLGIEGKRALPVPAAKSLAMSWNTDWNVKLNHFFGTPCPAIQEYRLGRDHPIELIAKFTEMEKEWRGGLSGVIDKAEYEKKDYRPRPEVFIQIDSEWAWYDLNIDACELEGEAMGHCGNEQNRREDDTILSLRREVNDQFVRPSLTFILHSNGYLGEMKGRSNKKPHPKYHPAIIKLLNHPRIKGVQGGGFEPENNFSIFDLPEAEAKTLIETKPSLSPLSDMARFYTESKAEWVKPMLDHLVEQQFGGEDIEGVNPDEDRIDISSYSLKSWLGNEISDTSPSYLFWHFWQDRGFSTEHPLFASFLRALVPFDKSFALECVECELTSASRVTTYLPYSGLPMAMQENLDQWDDGGAPLLYQCHDSIDDWDYEEPNFKEYCDAIDYSVVAVHEAIAQQAIYAACDPEATEEEREAAGRILQRQMANP